MMSATSPGRASASIRARMSSVEAQANAAGPRRPISAASSSIERRAVGRNRIVVLEIDRREVDPRGAVEGGGKLGLENVAARGVGARFEGGQDAPAGEALCHRRERHADRGRMMREVVDHGDAARLAD